MAYPGTHAAVRPDHPAIVMAGSGEVRTYRELDEASNRVAQLLRAEGVQRGDHIALFMENQVRFMEIVWGALRSGVYITAVNSFLAADEAAYIIDNCDATMLFTSAARTGVVDAITSDDCPSVRRWIMSDLDAGPEASTATNTAGRWEDYDTVVAAEPVEPIDDQSHGIQMLYSSGTTGRPKGVKRPLPEIPIDEMDLRTGSYFAAQYGYGPDMVYLSPAPMYHAAPLAFSTAVHRHGGTLVIMERFDADRCLAVIERHEVTHAQFVPTMFVRMLKLDDAQRTRHDTSSLQVAIHAAAPCPIPVKQRMIEWWGPIIAEYYAGSEGNGSTFITSEEWLAHPGSVGRPRRGMVHICDDEGNDLPPGETGAVYFSGGGTYEYYKDPAKTAGAALSNGRTTLGDIGHLDDDGYLYLTDRKAHMIISGGVNIYPQEIENVLIEHPSVGDVAVFGIPNAEMGEEVKAAIELIDSIEPSQALAEELIAFTRQQIAHYKCPKSIDFEDQLPRLPTGKLYKRLLRDRYLEAAAAEAATEGVSATPGG